MRIHKYTENWKVKFYLINGFVMELDIKSFIGEATSYDKKQMLEIKRPKSWLRSVSAFVNGEGGTLIFGTVMMTRWSGWRMQKAMRKKSARR